MRKRAYDSWNQTAAETGPSDAQVEMAARAFSLLADPTRLSIMWLLSAGEYDVGSLAEATAATPAATSQHLAKLRLAGVVSVRHEGRRRLYASRGSHVARLVQEALFYADHRLSGEPDHP